MDARHPPRARRAVEEAPDLPPALRDALDAAPGEPGAGDVVTQRHGTRVRYTAGPHGRRRILEVDRHRTLLAALRWGDEGSLALASVRMPDRTWATIEPRAATDPRWGASDRLWHGTRPLALDAATPLSVFAALDYGAITAIPPLAEPARLPPGAGTSVLNLIAALAVDQAQARLAYAGPYPTEALFLALLESFRYETDAAVADPLDAFIGGDLLWRPAPHERAFEAGDVVVHLRERVEKVVWESRTYYRRDWQTVQRHAPRRVRDAGDRVVCGLWALGMPLEDHLHLGADGALHARVAPSVPPGVPEPLSDESRHGIVEHVALDSVPALAASVRTVGASITLAWAPVDRDLVRIDGDRVDVSLRIRDLIAARVTSADAPAALALGVALLAEIAGLVGDTLRARAQAWLAGRPLMEQEAALALEDDPGREASRERLVRGVEALVTDLRRGRSVQRGRDQPDVEEDEEADRGG